jgi:vacuolar-type H+-ATPase subunit I/STV1
MKNVRNAGLACLLILALPTPVPMRASWAKVFGGAACIAAGIALAAKGITEFTHYSKEQFEELIEKTDNHTIRISNQFDETIRLCSYEPEDFEDAIRARGYSLDSYDRAVNSDLQLLQDNTQTLNRIIDQAAEESSWSSAKYRARKTIQRATGVITTLETCAHKTNALKHYQKVNRLALEYRGKRYIVSGTYPYHSAVDALQADIRNFEQEISALENAHDGSATVATCLETAHNLLASMRAEEDRLRYSDAYHQENRDKERAERDHELIRLHKKEIDLLNEQNELERERLRKERTHYHTEPCDCRL